MENPSTNDNPAFRAAYDEVSQQLQELTNQNADAHKTLLKEVKRFGETHGTVRKWEPSSMNTTEFELPSIDGKQPPEMYLVPDENSAIGIVMREVLEAMHARDGVDDAVTPSQLKQMDKENKKRLAMLNHEAATAINHEDIDEQQGTMEIDGQKHASKTAVESKNDQSIAERGPQPDGSCVLICQENDADYLHEIVSLRAPDGRETMRYLHRVFGCLTNGISLSQYQTMVKSFIIKKQRAKRLEMEAEVRRELDSGVRYKHHNKQHDNALLDEHM